MSINGGPPTEVADVVVNLEPDPLTEQLRHLRETFVVAARQFTLVGEYLCTPEFRRLRAGLRREQSHVWKHQARRARARQRR
jgi:hypothetical protein